MKIFYAWQSDTPSKVNRGFIRRALDLAVEQLGDELNLEEAERSSVDQDTQGVKGSPVIAETIFQKIRDAAVVVVDVTISGTTETGKRLINSNVAIELGFAHGHHGDAVLLKVMNTYYGLPDDLPFDLRHRGFPIQYSLSPEQPKSEFSKVEKRLARELKHVLALYLTDATPQPKEFIRTASTMNIATFWQVDELIVRTRQQRFSEEIVSTGYTDKQPLIYLRIWPKSYLEPLSPKVINDDSQSVIRPFGGEPMHYSWERNGYGKITFALSKDTELLCSTQLLKTGEIWGHNAYLLIRKKGFNNDVIPTGTFESDMTRTLYEYLRAAKERLGYPDSIWIEAGMVNIKNYQLPVPDRQVLAKFSDPIYEDISVQDVVDTGDVKNVVNFLVRLFERVHEAAGLTRPEGLNGFPP